MVMWGRWAKPVNPPYVANYNASFDGSSDIGQPDPANRAIPDNDPSGAHNTSFGWADSFDRDILPDGRRTGRKECRQQPEVDEAKSYARRDADIERRRKGMDTVENPSFKPVPKDGRVKTATLNPYRLHAWSEGDRPTSGVNPNEWEQHRIYGAGYKGIGTIDLNGEHFSMAQHRHDYEHFGMAPVRSWRNTYRLDPQPWDANLTDSPSNTEGYETAINRDSSPAPVAQGTRSYRL